MIALAPMLAQAALLTPYKFVLSQNQGGITVVEYPSAERCEAAKKSLLEQTARSIADGLAKLPRGAELTSTPLLIAAICIPG